MDAPGSLDFVWDQAEQRVDAQMRQADSLDTKAGLLVGFHALAAGLLANVFKTIHGLGKWVTIVVIGGLVVSGWLSVRAFRTQDYDRRPGPDTLWSYASNHPSDMRRLFLSTRLEAIETNRRVLNAKATALGRSLRIFAMVALVTVIAIVTDLATR